LRQTHREPSTRRSGLSAAGDRLALVALTLLVHDRTRSPLLAAAAYLPWVIGGLFLADVTDRRPQRTVMVACDAARAVPVAAMTVPGVPAGALVVLLFVTTMFAPQFETARALITPAILAGDRYALGTAALQTTFLVAEVAGAAAGGVAVAFLGVRPALAIDAATFAAPVAAGLVLASTSAATAVGMPLFSRLIGPRRPLALMGPLAVATCATSVLTAFRPGLAVSLVIFSVSAACGAYPQPR